MYFTYELYSISHDKYYVGSTNDVYARLERHNKGYENYSSKFAPWELLWFTQKENRSEAVILELKLKNLSKARLKSFISKYSSHFEGRDE